MRRRLNALAVPSPSDTAHQADAADVVIDVVYDGADLDEVARHTGLEVADVIEAHTAPRGGSDSVASHRFRVPDRR